MIHVHEKLNRTAITNLGIYYGYQPTPNYSDKHRGRVLFEGAEGGGGGGSLYNAALRAAYSLIVLARARMNHIAKI